LVRIYLEYALEVFFGFGGPPVEAEEFAHGGEGGGVGVGGGEGLVEEVEGFEVLVVE